MRLIDGDKLKEEVLKWLPSDPCGIEEREFPFETNIVASLLMEIAEAPTIEQPTWISCSERLPKIGEVVLVTWEWGCKKYITIAYMVTIRGVTYWDSKLQHEFEPLNVLAWMPLPKSYEGSRR